MQILMIFNKTLLQFHSALLFIHLHIHAFDHLSSMLSNKSVSSSDAVSKSLLLKQSLIIKLNLFSCHCISLLTTYISHIFCCAINSQMCQNKQNMHSDRFTCSYCNALNNLPSEHSSLELFYTLLHHV